MSAPVIFTAVAEATGEPMDVVQAEPFANARAGDSAAAVAASIVTGVPSQQ